MSDENIKALEKEANKLKFIASQKASELHDLIEDRLLSDFEDIPVFAEETFNACKLWSLKQIEYVKAKNV